MGHPSCLQERNVCPGDRRAKTALLRDRHGRERHFPATSFLLRDGSWESKPCGNILGSATGKGRKSIEGHKTGPVSQVWHRLGPARESEYQLKLLEAEGLE